MPAVIDQEFLRAVLTAMKDKGLNQTTLAKRLNVEKSTVSRWLSGRTEPKAEHRELLTLILGLPDRWAPTQDRDILHALARNLLEELLRRHIRLSPNGHGLALAQAWELVRGKADPMRSIPEVVRTVVDLLEAGIASPNDGSVDHGEGHQNPA